MLEFNYTLSKEDNYIFQLYVASKSPLIKKQRRRVRYLLLAVLTLLGFIFFKDSVATAIGFFAAAIIFFFFYSEYSKWFYRRYLRKHVDEFFDPDAGTTTLRITEQTLESFDKKSNSSIRWKEFLSFIEIDNYFFIQLTKAMYYIIPKDQVDEEEVRRHLQKCSEEFGVPYVSELDWKWR
ncbi:YcxB family protein [Prevotella sp. 10(H)]|uniref:YcxB family protein n=1 Tax=Prevotella sp. 10(H) TaxID=1158294 RepID=UPI0004A6F2DD|nr:YcxB family protein [Prevotella sp. 10(H)]